MHPSSRHLIRSVGVGALAISTSVVLTASLPAGAAEIGPDDFQVSQSAIDHREPEVAYNPTDDEYLAVWSAVVGGESQIYGRRISAAGTPIGDEFQIAAINQGDVTTNADEPDVVWNSVDNEYVVVFEGDDTVDAPGFFVTTLEIYAVEVTAGGVPGTPVEISDAGNSDADGNRDANEPAIAHNPDRNEYFVVWDADDDGSSLANNEFEIFGQRLSNDLAELGTDTRYSDVGPDVTGAHDADSPAVAYLGGEYLIVFEADDAVDNFHEIHGQHVDAATGAELGANDFIVSTATANEEAREPEVAANPDNNDFMVTWIDTDDAGGGNFDVEVHGAYVAAGGGTTSTFAISSNGVGPTFSLDTVDISYHPDIMLYSITWAGEQTGVTGADEYEVFHAHWDPDTSAVVGTIDRITTNGTDGVADTTVERPSIAAGPSGTAAVVYDAGGPSTIFGQLVGQAADLSVTKTLTTPTNPGPGDTVSYTIAYGNGGPGDASDVTITEVVPAGLDYTSASPLPSSIVGDTLTWDVASITSGGGGSITLDLTVDGTAVDGQSIINAASISSTGPTGDPVAANDTGSAAAITVDFPPSVTIDQGAAQVDPTTAGPIVFDVVFSEDVTGFDDGTTDVVIGGTAPGTLSAVIAADTASNYTVTVSGMTGDGTVTATIPSAAAIDSSGKSNTASTSTDNEVTLDTTAPTLTVEQAVGQGDPTGGSPVNFTATFSEDVAGFVDADVTVGGTAGATTAVVTGGPAVYDIAVSGMTGDGTVVASVAGGVAADDAGNANTASTSVDNTVTYDATAPVPVIATAEPDPTNTDPFDITVDFGETVTGFVDTDITVGNGTVAVFSDDGGGLFTATIDATADGEVTVDVAAAVAADESGNDNLAATQFTIDVDTQPPSSLTEQAIGQADPTNATSVMFTVTFSEDVTGFDETDVTLGGTAPGTLAATVTGGPQVYDIEVTGYTGDGTVTAFVPDGAAADDAGNSSLSMPSSDFEVTVDRTAPTVTIDEGATQADPANMSPIVFDVVFSEDVTGFDETDVTLGGTAPGVLAVTVTPLSATDYTVEVAGMTGDGTVTASIDAGAAIDAAGNDSEAGTSGDNEVTFDPTAPTVTIEQGAAQTDSANAEPIVFDVVFSEPVSGFAGADVILSGSAGAATAVVAGVGDTYTVSVTGMTSSGTVVADLAVAAAQDAAGNDSAASTSVDNVVTYIAGDVTPGVNDPPVVTAPTSASAELAEALAFTGADAVSVADPDALDSEIVVTLTADDVETVISVVATAGVTVTGDGTDAVTLTGSQSDINAALAGLEITVNNTGDTTVTVAADDQGNTDTGGPLTDAADIVITATDTTPPTITVPVGGVTASNDPGQAGAVVDFTVTVDDPGSLPTGRLIELQAAPSLACTPDSGSFFPIGETTVGCTATDASGNSATESFVVTVIDDEDPVISGAVDQTVTPPAAGVRVSYVQPTATDNSGSATITCSPASGSTTWTGARTVTCTAADAAGNTATASFTVTANVARIPDTGGSLTLLPWAIVLLFLGSVLFGAAGVKRRRGAAG